MSAASLKSPVQARSFQRFTIRLVEGKFVRVPQSDLPSTQADRQAAASNQPEVRDLFRLINGRFQRVTQSLPGRVPLGSA